MATAKIAAPPAIQAARIVPGNFDTVFILPVARRWPDGGKPEFCKPRQDLVSATLRKAYFCPSADQPFSADRSRKVMPLW
jgi:hypothetical protein